MRSMTPQRPRSRTWRPHSSCTSRTTASSMRSPSWISPPGMLHFPRDGGAPRRTRTTRSPSSTTAPTPARGASGYSREGVVTSALSPCTQCPLPLGERVRVRGRRCPPPARPPGRRVLLAGQRRRERGLIGIESAHVELDPVGAAKAGRQRFRGLGKGRPPAQRGFEGGHAGERVYLGGEEAAPAPGKSSAAPTTL